ncbi:Uma2 family endonuclease [bacterium]|nr:Uma2 family endonuclease [bacterium]
MAYPASALEDGFEEPDVSHLITEDDTPVDNPFSERQQKLLSECLEVSYARESPFVALVNVAIYYSPEEEALVPDFLLSLDVRFPREIWAKRNRSYFLWRYGKAPDLMVEIVSGREGHEDTHKLARYATVRVAEQKTPSPPFRMPRRPYGGGSGPPWAAGPARAKAGSMARDLRADARHLARLCRSCGQTPGDRRGAGSAGAPARRATGPPP